MPFVSVIRYRFRDRPLTDADRFINPLGFEVLRYRKDPEAPYVVSEAPVAQTVPSAVVETPSPPSGTAQ